MVAERYTRLVAAVHNASQHEVDPRHWANADAHFAQRWRYPQQLAQQPSSRQQAQAQEAAVVEATPAAEPASDDAAADDAAPPLPTPRRPAVEVGDGNGGGVGGHVPAPRLLRAQQQATADADGDEL